MKAKKEKRDKEGTRRKEKSLEYIPVLVFFKMHASPGFTSSNSCAKKKKKSVCLTCTHDVTPYRSALITRALL